MHEKGFPSQVLLILTLRSPTTDCTRLGGHVTLGGSVPHDFPLQKNFGDQTTCVQNFLFQFLRPCWLLLLLLQTSSVIIFDIIIRPCYSPMIRTPRIDCHWERESHEVMQPTINPNVCSCYYYLEALFFRL